MGVMEAHNGSVLPVIETRRQRLAREAIDEESGLPRYVPFWCAEASKRGNNPRRILVIKVDDAYPWMLKRLLAVTNWQGEHMTVYRAAIARRCCSRFVREITKAADKRGVGLTEVWYKTEKHKTMAIRNLPREKDEQGLTRQAEEDLGSKNYSIFYEMMRNKGVLR